MSAHRMTFIGRRFELREKTRDAHERLDHAVGKFATLDEYRWYIAGLWSFRRLMDCRLRDVAWPSKWRWRPTPVSDVIAQDAADLGLVPTRPNEIACYPKNSNALLGELYVLEGSTLGARILRQRAALLGLHEAYGARHLWRMSHSSA